MPDHTVVRRNTCRLCGARDPRRFLHFESLPFFDEVIPESMLGKEFLAPMDIYFCHGCRSVQSQHDVNVTSYYTDYQYVASDSSFIRSYMDRLAGEAFARFGLQSDDHVIEIGSADGYQLARFKERGASVLGFEPAENLCALAEKNGIDVVNALFTAETLDRIPVEFRPAHAVVLLHTFDHLMDPLPFLATVRQILDPMRGVLIMEVHDLDEIVQKRETALFGHEHATFLHVGSMNRLLERCGFVLLDANFIPHRERRGSSMLIAAGLRGCSLPVNGALDLSTYAYLDEWATFEQFGADVARSFERLRNYVRAQSKAGRRIAGYGGWGRGVTTLAMAELGSDDLVYVCDRNPALHGLYTPGTHVPIVSPGRILDDKIDEVIVFNYAYIDEIREQLAEYVASGGKITSVLDLLSS